MERPASPMKQLAETKKVEANDLELSAMQNRTQNRSHMAEADDVAAAQKLRESALLSEAAGDLAAHDTRMTEADLAESRASLLSPTRTELAATTLMTTPTAMSSAALGHKEKAIKHERASDQARLEGKNFLAAAEGEQAANEFRQASQYDTLSGDTAGSVKNKINADTLQRSASRDRERGYASPLTSPAALALAASRSTPNSASITMETQSRVRATEGKSYDNAADNAYVSGKAHIAVVHGEQAAAAYKEASDIDLSRGDYVMARQHQMDSSLAASKARSRSPPSSPLPYTLSPRGALSPAASSLAECHRRDAVSRESAANRAALQGRSMLASAESELAAAEYRKAAVMSEVNGDVVSSRRNEIDASLADSRAATFRTSPGGTMSPMPMSPSSLTSPAAASALRAQSSAHSISGARHDSAADRAYVQGQATLAALENQQAAREYQRAAELSSLGSDIAGVVANNAAASLSASKAGLRSPSTASASRLMMTSPMVMSPQVLTASTASTVHRAEALKREQSSNQASLSGQPWLAAAEAQAAAVEYKKAAEMDGVAGDTLGLTRNSQDSELASSKAVRERLRGSSPPYQSSGVGIGGTRVGSPQSPYLSRSMTTAAMDHASEAVRRRVAAATAEASGHHYLAASEDDQAAAEYRRAAALAQAGGDLAGSVSHRLEAEESERKANMARSVARLSVRNL